MVPNNCSFQTGVTSGRIFGLSLAPRLDGCISRCSNDQTSPQRTVHLGEEFLHLIFPYILRHKLFWSAHNFLHGKGPTNPLYGCLSIAIIQDNPCGSKS